MRKVMVMVGRQAVVAIGALLVCLSLRADGGVSVGVTASAQLCFGEFYASNCPVSIVKSSPAAASIRVADHVRGSAVPEQAFFNLIGSATFGRLRAFVAETATGDSSSGTANAFVQVGFTDGLTFNAPNLSGGGTAYVWMTVHHKGFGAPNATSAGQFGYGLANYYIGPSPITKWSGNTLPNTSGSIEVRSEPIPFTFGQQVLVTAVLSPITNANCLPRDSSECASWRAFATSDVLDTAVVSRIEVFDSAGKAIRGFEITSASGTTYTSAGLVGGRE